MQIRNKIILLVIAAGLVVVGWWGYARTKMALMRQARESLTKMAGADIRLNIIDFGLGGTLVIDDMVVRSKRDTAIKEEDAIFKARHVRAKFGMLSLLIRKPTLKSAAIDDFIVNVQYDVNEARWNTDVLKILRAAGPGRIPELRLKNGVIKYSKLYAGKVLDIISLPVDAAFKATDRKGDTLLVTLRGADTTLLKGVWQTAPSGKVALTGQVSTVKVPLFENVWNLKDVFIEISYDANTINIEKCRMRLGEETNLSAKGRIDDYRKRGVFNVEASIENLHHGPNIVPNTFVYSKSLLDNVPSAVTRKFFDDFHPTGVVDIEMQAKGSFAELEKTTCTGKLYCKNVLVKDKDFPYQIDQINGTIDFTDKKITLNKLDARHKDAVLIIDGYSKDFLTTWDCNMTVTSPSLPLDEDVYNALDADQKRGWSMISPVGNIGMEYRFIREPNGLRHKWVTADLQGVDAQYRQFNFPLKNLTGKMVIESNQVTFNNVISQYNERRIVINGWSSLIRQKTEDRGQKTEEVDYDSYCLSLDAAGLEIGTDVAQLLEQRAGRILSSLNAGGKVHILAQISENGGSTCPPDAITIECLGNTIDCNDFAYPLRDIHGKFTLAGNEATFENMTATVPDEATPEAVRQQEYAIIRVDGRTEFGEAGLKWGQFHVNAMNVAFDRRLGGLLGQAGQDIYQRLAPQGRADITVDSLQITKDDNDFDSVNLRGSVAFRDCSFTSMLPVAGLNGRLAVEAQYKGGDQGFKSIAKIDVNNVRVKDKLLQKLIADISFDGPAKTLELKNISSALYGGKLIGTFILADSNQNDGGYKLNALFDSIDLKEFLSTQTPDESSDYISGLMSGQIEIDSHGQQKSGRVQIGITDMRSGKTSLFGKILSVLKFTEPKDYIFDKTDITAYLRGDDIIVEQMDLSGNAFALRGDGKADLKKNKVDLEFFAAGPRFDIDRSMLQTLAEGLSPAVAKVTVTGDINNPQINRTALPVISETLEILGMRGKDKCKK